MSSINLNEGSSAGLITTGGTTNINGNINVSQPQEQVGLEAFDLPHLIKTFKGREKQTEILNRLIFKENKKKIVICGLPGYGKTEFAKQYARHCVENNKIHRAFWIEAETDLRNSSIKLKKIYKEFKGQRCLFVFDNAISRQKTFEYEPPEDGNYILLLTSIETDWGDDVEPFKLDPLSPEAVVDVYQSILNKNYQKEDRKLYEQLADVVGNVPLGLQVTGAYVRQQKRRLGRGFNLESYIQTLKQSQKQIVNSKILHNLANPYEKSMYGALKVSLEKIMNEEDTELKELALIILYICCYLDPRFLIFGRLFNMSATLTQDRYDINQFQNALGLLDNFCFVYVYQPYMKIITMHRYTQYILRFHASEYDPQLQSKCYWVCLQSVLLTNNPFYLEDPNLITIISHSDDNVITVYKFYEEHASTDEIKERILRCLSRYGASNCLKTIFDKSGAQLTKTYINLLELLRTAVRHNQLETVKLLLQYGGDVNNKSFLLDTPLHEAVNAWNIDAINILIKHQADLNARNYKGYIPLFSLFRDINSENIKNMQIPLDKETPYITYLKQIQKDLKQDTYIYFHKSLESNVNMDAIIDILDQLKCEDYKNTTNNKGETLLHIASVACSEEIVTLLINKYNMDVNKQDLQGRTPLYSIISHSTKKYFMYIQKAITTARVLIMHGARIEYSNGKTLIEFAEELEENNVFVNALCDNRCLKELNKVFDYLGEERTKNFITKQNIIGYAVILNQLDILNFLLQHDVNIEKNMPLHVAAAHWKLDAIRILLQRDADLVKLRNYEGKTALFFFIYGAYTRILDDINLESAIKILDLLKIEDQKHITDNLGRTLLHASAAGCQAELVELFVNKYKINKNVKDKSGKTPFQEFISSNLICLAKEESIIKIARLLGDYDDHLDDNAILTLVQSLIKEEKMKMQKYMNKYKYWSVESIY